MREGRRYDEREAERDRDEDTANCHGVTFPGNVASGASCAGAPRWDARPLSARSVARPGG
ncbi:hypothetical protein GCM10025786_28250 [Nocardioides caeni]